MNAIIFDKTGTLTKGEFGITDIIREESKEAVKKLKEMNIKPMMPTEDNRNVARWVSEEIGIEEYFAEVLHSCCTHVTQHNNCSNQCKVFKSG
ncbi:MAG: HAD family hydrolase [Actinobacteria bacterium]|nr:HAD family hydrolase [Actinomycetota bacterium]